MKHHIESVRFNSFFDEKFEMTNAHDGDSYLDVLELIHARADHENHWGADEEFLVYVNENGIGFHHVIPAGYGTYTYDPIENFNFYYTKDFDAFMRYALTIDQREFLTEKRQARIREKLTEIWAPEVSNVQE
jgi:hypothetical protein